MYLIKGTIFSFIAFMKIVIIQFFIFLMSVYKFHKGMVVYAIPSTELRRPTNV